MTTTEARPAAPAPQPRTAPEQAVWLGGVLGRGGLALTVVVLVGAAVSAVLGVLSGPLWLDEAQSVAIARLPLAELPQALREDGAPPLYYLLLHAWMAVAGSSTVAVRLLTVALAALSLWLVHRLGTRYAGPAAGRVGLVMLAGLPWWGRYASETRMYLLVVVLVLAGGLALHRLRRGPSLPAFAGVAAVTGALLLTHYWSLFLLASVGAWHLVPLRRRTPSDVRMAVRVIGAMAVGSLAFLPWLPSFFFQSARTGAPWAKAPTLGDLLTTPDVWSYGPSVPRTALALAYVALAVVAARRLRGARQLAGLVVATVVLAWIGTVLAGGAYVGRYTAVVVPLVALLVGLGVLQLRERWQLPVLAALALTGVVTGATVAAELRTQGGQVADVLRETARPGDVVLFCPDQLGPSVARLAPEGVRLLSYPLLGQADRVVWVDYEQRNEAADPAAIAAQLHALAGDGQVYVDFAPGYRTLQQDCQKVVAGLAALRGLPEVELHRRITVFEDQRLYRFG